MLLRRTAAGTLPIAILDAKEHLRIDGEPDDMVVSGLLSAAVAAVGEMAGRVMSAETWVAAYGDMAGDLTLPKSPVTDVTGISYYTAGDVLTAASLADFYVFADDDKTIIRPKSGAWPIYSTRPDALQVTFTAGYGTLPHELRAAALLKLADLYANRGDGEGGKADMAIEALVNMHRLGWVAA